MRNALMIDYYLCTGCHSCEVACRFEHGYGDDQFGILLDQETPFPLDGKRWEFKFVPVPTSLCDGCPDRVAAGKQPACVHNCQARCMDFGTLDEMSQLADECDRRAVVFAL